VEAKRRWGWVGRLGRDTEQGKGGGAKWCVRAVGVAMEVGFAM